MSICVFVGPTLRREEVAAVLDAECEPPVAQGDVYRAARRGARTIGIIDGFFSGAPSVWHKEILWALSQGVRVFGSASMGALRAAELHRFGMRGVGRIFESFRDGTLEDDDEVAVVHGPAELGFVPVSEPMVNIRATLARAEAEGVVGPSGRLLLEGLGKSLFFPRRTWAALVAGALQQGMAEAEVEALREWLPRGRVDQKREDALAMLAAMKEPLPKQASAGLRPDFQRTHFFDEMVEKFETAAASAGALQQAIVEELRLEGADAYGRVRDRALLRLLAGSPAERRSAQAEPGAMRRELNRVREAHGLFTRAALDEWLARNDLDAEGLETLIADRVRSEAIARLLGPALTRSVLDEIRLSGAYERLADRARKKQRSLADRGIDRLALGRAKPSAADLRVWYFERVLRRSLPDDVDAFARELDLAGSEDFDGALRREWLFSRAIK